MHSYCNSNSLGVWVRGAIWNLESSSLGLEPCCLVRVGQLLMFTRLLWVLEEDIEILILDGRGEQGARVLGAV